MPGGEVRTSAPAAEVRDGDGLAGEARDGDALAGEVRDGDEPAGEVRDGGEPAAEGIRDAQRPGTTGRDDGPVPGPRHGSGSAGAGLALAGAWATRRPRSSDSAGHSPPPGRLAGLRSG